MNYLKTAASLCASILVIFSTHAYAVETVDLTSQASPEDAARVKAEIAAESSSSNPVANAYKAGKEFFLGADKVEEKITEGTGEMGSGGCPKEYESTTTITPDAEKVVGGLNCARAAIGQFVDRVAMAGSGVYKVQGAAEIASIHTEYQSKWKSCQTWQNTAATVCIGDNSEALSDGIMLINGLLSAGGVASIYDTCTSFGKAMDIGQKALAAYTAACTLARQPCVFTCGGVNTALVNLQAAIKKAAATPNCEPQVTSPDGALACSQAHTNFTNSLKAVNSAMTAELDSSNIKATGGKFSRCDRKYWANVASAGVGILQLANSLKQGKECEEESSALAANVTATCEIPANASLPECICLANPRTAGCSSGLSQVGELNAGSGQVVSGKAISGDATVGALGKDSVDGMSQAGMPGGSGSDSSGIGAPTGGGAGLGSIGGGGGGGVGEKGGGGKGSGLNTDILSGAGGGGGGGGYGGYKGSGDGGRGLRNYLPGGAKDPKRGLAGQGVGSKEVTGQAGKSNWEKVRDRYIDNKNSLIGN